MREIVAFIDRMISKRRGKANIVYQIKELTNIVISYSPPIANPPTKSQKKWKKVQKRIIAELA
jgi:hypothetical protein